MDNLLPAEYVEPSTGQHISAVYIYAGCNAAIALEDKTTGKISPQPCRNLSQALLISETAEKLVNR